MSQSETWVNVPCGKCPTCLSNRVNSWLVRLLAEEKVCVSSFFVTLTYAPETVPLLENGQRTLLKSDFQKFVKRLRKISSRILCSQFLPGTTWEVNCIGSIKYYAAGEYGTKFQRPHYHAIIFNATEYNIRRAWQLSLETIGDVDVAPCNAATMTYTLAYINKGKIVPAYDGDLRQPEFALMSKGMGISYLTPDMVAYHQADKDRFYVTLPEGIKTPMPRYLKNKIYSESDRHAYAKLIAKTSEFDEARRYLESGLSPPDYMRAKFEAKKASIINFKQKSKR